MTYEEIIKELKSQKNKKNIEGMARFGINPKNTLGISIYVLRPLAKRIGKNHTLALRLWKSGIHEARILASYIDEVDKVTEKQMDEWATDFDSWDICDQVCSGLFDQTAHAYKKAFEWSKKKEEFAKRAGFTLMAALSVHDKKASDAKMAKFFPVIIRQAKDERNFVRKAVNWALRNIGKRNKNLNRQAIKVARQLERLDDKTARWIAKDALRELTRRKFS
jgi:3-methyladenine DNA glycosylase AlkD